MAVVSMKQLLEAGVHFGHQTRRWNPKMRTYIYTERNGIHIIDLQKTVGALEHAYSYVRDLTSGGGKVLFVGTKKQAQEAIAEEAQRAGQFYVNQRWLGGLLTNFRTIQERLRRLDELEQMRDSGILDRLTKKEQLKVNDEIAKLTRMLGGIRGMRRLPDALFIIDTRKEHIAIHEAQRLDIPVVALVDTNSDPDEVTYPIPANDDAIRAVRLLSNKIAEAAAEGAAEFSSTRIKEEAEEGFDERTYEGGFSFEPEGYEASLEPQPAESEAEAELHARERLQDVIAETSSEPSFTSLTGGAASNEVTAGAAATTDDLTQGMAPGLAETGEDAFAGQVPPAAAESGLGPHPDAAE